MQGVGFRPFVHRLAGELELAGFVLNDERGVLVEVAGRAGARRGVPRPPARRRAAAGRGRAVLAEAVAPRGRPGFEIVESARGGRARRARLRRRGDLRRTACASSSTPPTGATATRSSTAPTAARASRSCAASPTTGRTRRWPASDVRRLPGRVRRPRRPPLPRPADRLPGLRPAARLRRLDAARGGDRGGGCRAALLRGGVMVAVKGLGGFHLACVRPTSARWRRCARASTARTSRSR